MNEIVTAQALTDQADRMWTVMHDQVNRDDVDGFDWTDDEIEFANSIAGLDRGPHSDTEYALGFFV